MAPLSELIETAKDMPSLNSLVPVVYEVKKIGKCFIGYKHHGSSKGDRFHFDHGSGVKVNQDAEIVWINK